MQSISLKKILLLLSMMCVTALLAVSTLRGYFNVVVDADTTPALQNIYKYNLPSNVPVENPAMDNKGPSIHPIIINEKVNMKTVKTQLEEPAAQAETVKPQVEQPVVAPQGVATQSNSGVTTDNWKLVRQFDILAAGSNQTNVIKPFACLKLIVGLVPPSPICIYDPKVDQWVSGSIQKYGAWEADLIRIVIKLLMGHSDMDFLDIGCNIGIYTIAVAKLGRRLVGIDANRRNLQLLSQSLVQGGLVENVTLVWNAISNHVENVTFKEEAKNVGGTEMVSNINTSNIDDDHKAVAVTLNDMIPFFSKQSVLIKMDIEKHELKAFEGGDRFLTQVNVPYIIMEWMHHRTLASGDGIIKYMTQRSYKPYDPRRLPSLLDPINKTKWPSDIIWIKDGAKTTL